MGKWLQWIVLSTLLGSPLLAGLFLVVAWWTVDRLTVGILPDPLKGFGRWRRVTQLRQRLHASPHDRKARFELAEILVEQRRHKTAIETLQPNLDAGDDDVYTLFLMGVACAGAGEHPRAENLLQTAQTRQPGFRLNAVDLELGRLRLEQGDFGGAREALERLVRARPSSVEGKFLLSRALEGLGDHAAATHTRDDAWADYAAAPVFQRRRERFWAWRARPSRPIAYAAIAFVVGMMFVRYAGPEIVASLPPPPDESAE